MATNNWGRWGAEDERGALNHLTPEVIKAAAASITTGRVYSLGIPIQGHGVPLLDYRGWRRAAAAHVLIDESTAMAVNRPDRALARTGFWTTGVTIFVLWNLTTLLGAVAGEQLGDPRDLGLDAAVGAAFLALLWPRLTTPTARVTALLAALVAAGAVTATPAGVPVLVAAGVALLVGALGPRRRGEP